MFEQLTRDISQGFRSLLQKPGMTAIAVIALALGIGTTTIIFSVMNSLMIKPLPYYQSGNLYSIAGELKELGYEDMDVSILDLQDWQAEQTEFEGIAGYYVGTINISHKEFPERYSGAYSSYNLLEVLKETPIVGRGFRPGEDAQDAEPVALLGYRIWNEKYNRNPNLVGQKIRINGKMTEIIGIMREDFHFPLNEDVWLPLSNHVMVESRSERALVRAFGRLKEGSSYEKARTQMSEIAADLAKRYPKTNTGFGVTVKPMKEQFINWDTRWFIIKMFAAGFCVLLIACANVANLLLARASIRSREMAVRSALGASRVRIIGQMLTESLVLAFMGAVGGVILAFWGIDFIWAMTNPLHVPSWLRFDVDIIVLLFALLLTFLSGLISGIIPALQSSRTNLNEMLKDGARTMSSRRLGQLSRPLLVFQIAASSFLLFCAGLSIKTMVNLSRIEVGYDSSNLLTMRLGLFEEDYPESSDRLTFYNDLVAAMKKKPGIINATATTWISDYGSNKTVYSTDLNEKKKENAWRQISYFDTVTPEFFDTLGIELIKGRFFNAEDGSHDKKVAIVNESFAYQNWPDQNPVGKYIYLEKKSTSAEKGDHESANGIEVVGVVKDVVMGGFQEKNKVSIAFYLPLNQRDARFMSLILRTVNDPLTMVPHARKTVLQLDPHLPIYWAKTMERFYFEQMYFYRYFSFIFISFGLIAAFLATVGIYGVMAFSINQKRREIGIRMALGAGNNNILRLVLTQSLVQLVIGMALGFIVAYFITHGETLALYEVSPNDPATYFLVIASLTSVALLACLLPARRAIRVHPMDALRYE